MDSVEKIVDEMRQRGDFFELSAGGLLYQKMGRSLNDWADRLAALAPAGVGVVAFARGIGHSWEGGGQTTIKFDGQFDVPLLTSYRLVPVDKAARPDSVSEAADAIDHALQRAAEDLPERYIIRVCVENGAGWVELDDRNGYEVENIDGTDLSIAEQIDAALEAARAKGGVG